MYSKEVADHIANPRNAGELSNPEGIGDVTNEVCNDRIRLTLNVVDGLITEAGFKASGCPPTIAAASVLTTLIVGSSLERAERLSRDDIIKALGRLPSTKVHCAALSIEALRAALECAFETRQKVKSFGRNPPGHG